MNSNSNITKRYLNSLESAKHIGYSCRSNYVNYVKRNNIDPVEKKPGGEVLYDIDVLNKYISLSATWLKEHMCYKQIVSTMFDGSVFKFKFIKKEYKINNVDIPPYVVVSSTEKFINVAELKRAIEAHQQISENRIPTSEAIDYMGFINSSRFSRFVKEFDINWISLSNLRYYRKSDLNKYLTLREKWYSEHISEEDAKVQSDLSSKEFSIFVQKSTELKSIESPLYLEKSNLFFNKSKFTIELNKYITSSEELITYAESAKQLNLSPNLLSKFILEESLHNRVVVEGKFKLIPKDLIEKYLRLQIKFWKEHYLKCDAYKVISSELSKELVEYSVPSYARCLGSKGNSSLYRAVYRKSDVHKKANTCKTGLPSGLTTKSDALAQLGLSAKNFSQISIEYGFIPKVFKCKKCYKTDDINRIISLQKEYFEEFVTGNDIENTHGKDIRDVVHKNISSVDMPNYALNLNIVGRDKLAFSRKEVTEFLKQKEHEQLMDNMWAETEFETFKARLGLCSKDLTFFEKSQYTKNKWFDIVHSKLNCNTGFSSRTKHMNRKLKSCILGALELDSLLQRGNASEIYELPTKVIALWYKNIKNPITRQYIYFLLQDVSDDVKQRLNGIDKRYKAFNIKDIPSYSDRVFASSVSNDEPVNDITYDYQTYIDVFNYLIDIKLHISNAFKYSNSNNGSMNYVSTWLYCLLHLNNGWRHGDVTTFPRLYLKDVIREWEIDSIYWFERNVLSVEKSRRIISRIISYDFRISKTQVFGHFFCSDKLAPAIATSILLLECSYLYNDNINIPKYDSPIMKFDNLQYNEPSKTLLNNCFNEFKQKDFKFASRKMNKTVLTLLYNTANQLFPSGYNHLMLPKYLRGHIEDMSTINYITFDIDQLETLTGELFQRGEFGFVTDALLNLVSNKPDKSISRTKEIAAVGRLFGNVSKVEATVGMLNSFNNEQEEMMRIINHELLENVDISDRYDECLRLTTNAYMGNLPSRATDIQCVFSEKGCKYPDYSKEKCLTCRYKIPNIYMLKTITTSLKEDMLKYQKTSNLSKKIRLSTHIHNKVDVIKEANSRYGQEYVYNCMDISRVEFIQLFSQIPKIEELETKWRD